jgi:hypothetical protein
MESDLQKHFGKMSAFEVITDLKDIFAPQARAERYEAFKLFFSSKMDEHSSVSTCSQDVWLCSTLECSGVLDSG